MHVFEKNSNIFNLLSEAVSEGILVINDDYLIVASNSQAERIFEYTKDGIRGQFFEILIPETLRKPYKEYLLPYFKEGAEATTASTKMRLGRKKNGKEFPVQISLNTFSLYGHSYVLALVRDITKRKEIERKHEIHTAALESALNGIVITDAQQPDNPIVYFNSAFQELSGYTEEEIYQRNCRFLQADDRNQEGVKRMREAIKNGTSCQVEIKNYKKDGTLFWNEVSINPIMDEEGQITHFVGIQNDITYRKTVAQELIHLGKIFNASLNEIYVFDAHSLFFINVNYGAQKNTGYSLSEFKDLTPLDLKPRFDKTAFLKLIRPLVLGEKEKINFETLHQRKNGSTYPVEVHLQLSEKGNKQVVVAYILDISERKNYTEKLEKTVEKRTKQLKSALAKEKELNDLKTKFLSMVSHEFKTPLSAILTSATLVGKYERTEHQGKREKHLKTIIEEVRQLNGILTDFLSMERLEEGKEVYKFVEFSLSKIINEVIYGANMLLKSGQRINYPQNIDDILIFQDQKVVSLCLNNLIYNAIRYSPEDTEIDLKVALTENRIVFHVVDQGIGIPLEDQKHIFKRYFRAENVLTSQGTGIGLNIVKNHVENLGGRVSFTSVEHKGSTFTLELPIKKKSNEVP
ncbi:sensor histidine kinase [Pareuzebyella sediminis]|uniref:sensor histidine kinase n=1 Tax=Pareuzebyella sediminis TaxID=2607998 RepID=UPI0011EFE75B|nr:PAS domain S-box protein [Pareuzebyella sediminis]